MRSPESSTTEADQASTGRATFARACAKYDENFRRELANVLIEAIGRASMVADAPVMAIRTTETLDALADVLVTVLAMVPRMSVPSELRKTAEALAKRVRREVAQCRAEGVADILGASRFQGHA